MKLRTWMLGVFLSVAGAVAVSAPVGAANIFGPVGSLRNDVPTEYKGPAPDYKLAYWNTCGNQSSLIASLGSGFRLDTATEMTLDVEWTSVMNAAGGSGPCTVIIAHTDTSQPGTRLSNVQLNPIRDASGNETGYGIDKGCGNLVYYEIQQGALIIETEIKGASGWTKEHTSSNPLPVEVGATVNWRHQIKITGTPPTGITASTVSKKDGGVVTLSGGSANISNKTSGVPIGGWATTTWTAPDESGAMYCQYLVGSMSVGDVSSEGNKEQCVIIGVLPIVPPTTDGEDIEYVSKLRACAVKVKSTGGTVENCVEGTTAGATASPNYAKTQDTIYYKYILDKIAQYQSRQNANYVFLPEFDITKTVCADSEDSEAIGTDCEPVEPTARTVPTVPGGTILSPAYISPAMEPWNKAADNCVLEGPSTDLPGISPSGCTNSETELKSRSHFEIAGSGYRIRNEALGLNVSDLSQTISLMDMRIIVHKNTDTHTYSYTYVPIEEGECEEGEECEEEEGEESEEGDEAEPIPATYEENQHTWIEVMPDGPLQATTSFAIPYNYEIEPRLNFYPANAQRIQIGGTNVSYTASLAVKPRHNSQVGETYATATRPDTRWQVIEFYLAPNVPKPNWNTTYSGAAFTCQTYTGAAQDCSYTSGGGSLNTDSEDDSYRLRYGDDNAWSSSQSPLVKDAPIGTKFCVGVAVMDKDSTYNDGYGSSSQGSWVATTPECVSIGKMPMTDVLGDGLYSDGKIEGALFDKTPSGQSDFGAFGSYGEYEVVSPATVKTFASGAALGTGAGGIGGSPLFGGATVAAMLSRNLINGSCQIAPLTFANAGCSTASPSAELGQLDYEATRSLYGRARDIQYRYTGRSDATAVGGSISPNNYNTCTGAQVSNTNSTGVTSCAHYVKPNGTLTINGGTLNAGRSLIIEATDTVIIGGDIAISGGAYTDISQIPQVMIFAPNIQIDPGVRRVDAWLLAGLDSGSGTINTCREISSVLELDGQACTNPLRISGPVIADRVLLHRTAGADIGMPGSARPAEVFYLSPATYLWAYNQSANLSQAFLTYAREVAPRF